jgi:hypothetical protein
MMVNVVVEGRSDIGAATAILRYVGHDIGSAIDKRGKSNLDPDIPKYNAAARWEPWVIFRDTDSKCPVELREKLTAGIDSWSNAFALRLAHSMTEAWLLADRKGFADYFGVSVASVPRDPETLQHAKQTVLVLCSRSSSRDVREGMVSRGGDTGPLFVSMVNDFAINHWSVEEALEGSQSLRRAVLRISELSNPRAA